MERMPTASYLEELNATLIGPGRVRRDLVREAADHLEDAADAYVRAGWSPTEAEELAIADFGPVDQIAPGFQTTVAVTGARRTALILLGALVIQPFLWDDGLELAAGTHAAAPPDSWPYAVLDAVIEIGGFFGLLGAIVVLALTAVGQRWFRIGRRTARAAAWYALTASVAVPAVGLSMIVLSGSVTPSLVALCLVLMVTPLALAGASARSTLAAC